MDHAEAHERIADLALEPSRLAALQESAEADDAALREHVRGCPECQAEMREWDHFGSWLGDALADNRREQLEPIAPPPDLRQRLLAAAHAEPKAAAATVPGAVEQNRGLRLLSRTGVLALAAVLALVAVGLGVLFIRDQSARLDQIALEQRWLTDTIAATNRILEAPDHKVVSLATADGATAGTLAWSRHDLVVMSNGLPPPAIGQVYRCWLNYDGRDEPMGWMWFVDGNAFWTSSTDDWASIELSPEKRFLVTLESADNDTDTHAGPIVLQASLGG